METKIWRDLSLFTTRLVVAFTFLWHGLPKALDPEMAMQKFAGFGLPPWLGPLVGAVETIAALLLVVGIAHRFASLTLVVVIAGALVTVQLPGGISAALERDLLILAASVFLAVHGPGRVVLAPGLGTRV